MPRCPRTGVDDTTCADNPTASSTPQTAPARERWLIAALIRMMVKRLASTLTLNNVANILDNNPFDHALIL
ncbi:hypothetical protein [Neosynechococcus sphagnicola]|uniref:hypothetical protein n=1 Tax=Neosynechococcus sphagnicola TaxID=1501145 RepID=UPI001EFA00C8|nr:hypothetical protein [Neosynechococcus sphagnicola]